MPHRAKDPSRKGKHGRLGRLRAAESRLVTKGLARLVHGPPRPRSDERALLAQLGAIVPGVLYLFDVVERRSLSVNPVATLGFTEEELLAMGDEVLPRLLHPEDAGRLNQHFDGLRSLGEGETAAVDYRMRHRDGGWRWFRSRDVVSHRDPDGRVRHVLGIAAEITGEKEAEQARLAWEERYQQLFEACPLPTWVHDMETLRFLAVNEATVQQYGYTREELLGTTIHAIVGRAGSMDSGHSAAPGQPAESHAIEARHRRRDGTPINVEVHSRTVTFAGRAARLMVVQDVTERRRAERERDEVARTISEALPNLVFLHTPDGRNRYVNQPFRDFAGREQEALLEDRWQDLLHADDAMRVRGPWREAVAEGRPYEEEVRLRRHDGVWRWFLVRTVPQRLADGSVPQWIGTATDITDLKRAEAALAEADRRKDEFLAMLAHELRNPLAPIQNACELLAQAGRKNRKVEAPRTLIQRQVGHLVRLVDDLLDVARVARGKIELRKSHIDLSGVVRHAVETSRPLIEGRRHQLTVTLPPSPVLAWGDFTRLAQVVSNLLNNAAKYTDDGGRIGVTLDAAPGPEGTEAVIRVRDNGRGIERAAIERLFDLFYQADRDLDRAEGGLGIGLSLVKILVELHGGQVEARSEGPGRGSELVVRLPCAAEAAERGAGGEGEARAEAGRLRIAVVDDHKDAADSLAALLELEGHDVRVAYEGAPAVAMALAERPDVVFLDVGLPGMNGYEACRAMRAAGLTETKIVALTGYGHEEARRASQEAGFDEHLVKPAGLASLRAVLSTRGRSEPDAPVRSSPRRRS